jgi:hypothetical protein
VLGRRERSETITAAAGVATSNPGSKRFIAIGEFSVEAFKKSRRIAQISSQILRFLQSNFNILL